MAAVQAGSKDEQRHKVEQQLQRSEGEWAGRGAVTQAGACGWASYSLHCWKSCFLQNYYIHWKTKPTWRLGVLRSLHITSIWDHGTEHECEHWVSLSKGDGDLIRGAAGGTWIREFGPPEWKTLVGESRTGKTPGFQLQNVSCYCCAFVCMSNAIFLWYLTRYEWARGIAIAFNIVWLFHENIPFYWHFFLWLWRWFPLKMYCLTEATTLYNNSVTLNKILIETF